MSGNGPTQEQIDAATQGPKRQPSRFQQPVANPSVSTGTTSTPTGTVAAPTTQLGMPRQLYGNPSAATPSRFSIHKLGNPGGSTPSAQTNSPLYTTYSSAPLQASTPFNGNLNSPRGGVPTTPRGYGLLQRSESTLSYGSPHALSRTPSSIGGYPQFGGPNPYASSLSRPSQSFASPPPSYNSGSYGANNYPDDGGRTPRQHQQGYGNRGTRFH